MCILCGQSIMVNHPLHLQTVLWVSLLNVGFSLLAVFHLAYLGLMFGGQSEEEATLELQVGTY